MTFLGELALIVLEVIGGALAIILALVLAFYMTVVVVITVLYAFVWGIAISCGLLDRPNTPKRMWPRCPKCDSPKWLGKPGSKFCTNCGWREG